MKRLWRSQIQQPRWTFSNINKMDSLVYFWKHLINNMHMVIGSPISDSNEGQRKLNNAYGSRGEISQKDIL